MVIFWILVIRICFGFRVSYFVLSLNEHRVSSIQHRVSTYLLPKSRSAKKVLKTCSKPVHFLQKDAKRRSFLTKKCKKTLIFTLIFELKTNKSYKITYFTIANHPIFQNFSQKHSISWFFIFFSLFLIFPFSILFTTAIFKSTLVRRLPAICMAGPSGGIANRKSKIVNRLTCQLGVVTPLLMPKLARFLYPQHCRPKPVADFCLP